MGGVAKTINKVLGIGGGDSVKLVVPETAEVPDYEGEREKAEQEALKNRNRLKALGMAGTILGGSLGEEGGLTRKKLLGE